mgnify:CR=1 FL=1
MPSQIVSFTLDGREVEVLVKPLATLQSLLREQLGETSTKEGCKQGGCGSCTVLVNGEPMNSCLLPVEDVAGQSVTTLKGITPLEGLHPVQQAFVDHDALQCGYCTPGMILSAVSLLAENPQASDEEIAVGLDDNLCRCGAHQSIVKAVRSVAQKPKA